ncbi:MAG: ATP synthase F1 subunit gamma [Candidatus Sumerlaeia bacterium]|nr:ATP synthase F1 subunit gamma [Candidatus Sumerlaeia bacterium]
MPENIKGLRRRVRSIKNTAKITRAMEMVSAAKLRRTQQVMRSAKPFLLKLEQVLGRLAQSESAKANQYFQRREQGERLLVVMTADRGLCGAFNTNLIKAGVRALKADPGLKVFAVGRKARDFFAKYHRARMAGELFDFAGRVDGPKAEQLGQLLLDLFESGKFSQIDIIQAEYVSSVVNRPLQTRFLPVEAASLGQGAQAGAAEEADYILEPSPERVFEALMPRYLKSKVYLALAETLTSEHSARMLSMNNATKNCKELVSTLTLRMNKLRQAAITTEIIEIVSGAEALN